MEAARKAPEDIAADNRLIKRRFMAVLLFLMLEVLPLAGIRHALLNESVPGLVIAVFFTLLGALPALGVWLGRPWGYTAARYITGLGLLGSLIQVARQGLSADIAVGMSFYGTIFILLIQTRPAAAKKSAPAPAQETPTAMPAEKAKPDNLGPWIKENIEAVIIAFIMALVIRCFFIEVFKIPSSSMEPYLMGDFPHPSHGNCEFSAYHGGRPGGDRIMVTKYYYALRPVERFDVAVFRFPLNQARNFIKRVVGLPNEKFFLDGGNIYYRKDDDPDPRYRIARKPASSQDSIWIDVAERPDFLANQEDFDDHWTASSEGIGGKPAGYGVADATLSTHENGGSRGARFTLHDLIEDSSVAVGEARIAFTLEAHGKSGRAFAEIVNEFGRFTLSLSPSEASELVFEGARRGQRIALRTARIEANRRYRVELHVYDGIVRALLDGRVEAEHEFIALHDDLKDLLSAGLNRSVSFGARELLISISELTVGRDIYYRDKSLPTPVSMEGPGRAIRIGPGKYLMMGDNVANSHDGRAWVKTTFTLQDGRTVVCEKQEVGGWDDRQRFQQQYKLDREPDFAIKSDQYGNVRWLYRDELVGDPVDEPYHFIEENYLIGRAFWIWWPAGRWFRLIR